MKIKIIKRDDPKGSKTPAARVKKERPKKKRTLESTVQSWIYERRENDDAEHRSRQEEFSAWNRNDPIHATAA